MAEETTITKPKPIFHNIVAETEHYTVTVMTLSDVPYETYGIRNKQTGCIEGIQSVLSQAMDMMDLFTTWLNARYSKDKAPTKTEVLRNVFEQIEET